MKILQLYKMFNFLVIYILEAKASYVFFFNQIFSHRDGRDKCEFYYYFITIFKYNIIILKILIFF